MSFTVRRGNRPRSRISIQLPKPNWFSLLTVRAEGGIEHKAGPR